MRRPETVDLLERIGAVEKALLSQLSALQSALGDLGFLREVCQGLAREKAGKETVLEPLMDAPEAAKILGLTKARIYVLAASGRLPGKKFGKYWKFAPGDLRKFMDRQISS